MTGSSNSAVGAVETLVLDAMSFAGIGSAVGSANNSLHTQLVGSLGKVVSFVETLTGAINTVLKDYEALDQKTADSYKSLSLNGGTTAQTAAQTTGTPAATPAPAPAHPAATPATPAAGTHQPLPNGFVTQLMQSEGSHGNQGGVDEVYGFRQSSHNGYDQIMAARQQYGQGSPQEQAVVANLLSQHADQAGAQDFTDPGIRAAIASSAHMRGIGGTRAILNSMATGDTPTTSARSVTADNMAALRQMTPDQFQQSFHDARIDYDQTVYGNTTTHVHGQAMTWWQAYGNGLTTRYNREQTQFEGYSQAAQGGGQ
jgi:pyruvate/2-oxoglutarate dehydrogenase complex dihydrolipoamide acyltransferase (E2) component